MAVMNTLGHRVRVDAALSSTDASGNYINAHVDCGAHNTLAGTSECNAR